MNVEYFADGLDPTDPPSIQRLRIENRVLAPVRRQILNDLHKEVPRTVVTALREEMAPLIQEYGEQAVMPVVEKMVADHFKRTPVLIDAVESATPQLRDAARPVVDALFMAIVD